MSEKNLSAPRKMRFDYLIYVEISLSIEYRVKIVQAFSGDGGMIFSWLESRYWDRLVSENDILFVKIIFFY